MTKKVRALGQGISDAEGAGNAQKSPGWGGAVVPACPGTPGHPDQYPLRKSILLALPDWFLFGGSDNTGFAGPKQGHLLRPNQVCCHRGSPARQTQGNRTRTRNRTCMQPHHLEDMTIHLSFSVS